MHLLLKISILLCCLQYVTPTVDIPAIFQKPKKTIQLPTPKTLDIREVTSDVYNCEGFEDGNYVNPEDCQSFYACVKNHTYYVGCPEFPAYKTYYNPERRLCDQSDEKACLQEINAEGDPKSNEEEDKDENKTDDKGENSGEDSEQETPEDGNDVPKQKEDPEESKDDSEEKETPDEDNNDTEQKEAPEDSKDDSEEDIPEDWVSEQNESNETPDEEWDRDEL